MSQETIGIVGIGLLGSALAERLLQAGYSVCGFDLEPARRRQLEILGGQIADSSLQVVAACRRTLLSLPDSNAVESLLTTIEDQLRGGSLLVDTTTGDPEATVATGQRLAARGVAYLDAAVAGSSAQARVGDIVVLVGGDKHDLQAAEDLLSALARQVFHLGPCGSGARMKLVTNLVLGLNRAVLAEGLSLARACGIDLEMALDVLRSGAAYSSAMDVKGPKMIAGDFSPQARLDQHHKDVRLILDLALRCGARTPLTTVHEELLALASERGFGQADNSAVIRAYD